MERIEICAVDYLLVLLGVVEYQTKECENDLLMLGIETIEEAVIVLVLDLSLLAG